MESQSEMNALYLDSEIQYVKGVGPKRCVLLRARGINTVQDLLLRFPRHYEDRSRLAFSGHTGSRSIDDDSC